MFNTTLEKQPINVGGMEDLVAVTRPASDHQAEAGHTEAHHQGEPAAEDDKVPKAIAAPAQDHEVGLVADGRGKGTRGAEQHCQHHLLRCQPRHTYTAQDRVQGHDGGRVGHHARQSRRDEEDAQQEPVPAQHLELEQGDANNGGHVGVCQGCAGAETAGNGEEQAVADGLPRLIQADAANLDQE